MSKRFGRNQRRKLRQEVQAREQDFMQAVRSFNELDRKYRNAQREISEMVRNTLKPAGHFHIPVDKPLKATAIARLEFTHPSPERRYDMDMTQLRILSGDEAVGALAMEIAKDLALSFRQQIK